MLINEYNLIILLMMLFESFDNFYIIVFYWKFKFEDDKLINIWLK